MNTKILFWTFAVVFGFYSLPMLYVIRDFIDLLGVEKEDTPLGKMYQYMLWSWIGGAAFLFLLAVLY